jgi:hypothetical protein
MLRIAALAFCLAMGCSDKGTKTAQPPPTQPADAVLVIAPAALSGDFDGKHNELRVESNGKVILDGKEVGLVQSSGELEVGGKVVAKVDRDGKMTIVAEPREAITIREDGTLTDPEGKVMLEFGADGMAKGVLTQEMKNVTLKISGDKSGRRALMLAFLGVEKPAP